MKTELGYYTVNNISFGTNKVSAVLEAQKTGAEVGWYFFDESFKKANWLVEPTLTLDQLYEIRARQIRDAYDYVIIFLSGGADSNNVIRSFLNNNIHVDEVVALIPESGLKNYNWNDKDFSAGNVMSETKYAQYPILHEVSTKSSKTKITVLDFFDDIVNMESDSWIYESEGDLIGMTGARYGRLDSLTHVKNLAEQGKRIASVWGTDKPIVGFSPHNSDVNFVLVDIPVYLSKYPFKNVYQNVDRVLFYWSPDLPELMVKQAHVVAKEMHKPENIHIYNAVVNQGKKLFKPTDLSTDAILSNILTINSESISYSPKTIYQRGIVPFIYPNTHDPDLFQSRKFETGQTFLSAFNNWIKDLHDGTRIMQMITSDFSLFYKNISPKYLNPNKTGFNVCRKIFKIGSHDDFKPLTK